MATNQATNEINAELGSASNASYSVNIDEKDVVFQLENTLEMLNGYYATKPLGSIPIVSNQNSPDFEKKFYGDIGLYLNKIMSQEYLKNVTIKKALEDCAVIINLICAYSQCTAPKKLALVSDKQLYGAYSKKANTLLLNLDFIKEFQESKITYLEAQKMSIALLSTLFHELQHLKQYGEISKYLNKEGKVDSKYVAIYNQDVLVRLIEKIMISYNNTALKNERINYDYCMLEIDARYTEFISLLKVSKSNTLLKENKRLLDEFLFYNNVMSVVNRGFERDVSLNALKQYPKLLETFKGFCFSSKDLIAFYKQNKELIDKNCFDVFISYHTKAKQYIPLLGAELNLLVTNEMTGLALTEYTKIEDTFAMDYVVNTPICLFLSYKYNKTMPIEIKKEKMSECVENLMKSFNFGYIELSTLVDTCKKLGVKIEKFNFDLSSYAYQFDVSKDVKHSCIVQLDSFDGSKNINIARNNGDTDFLRVLSQKNWLKTLPNNGGRILIDDLYEELRKAKSLISIKNNARIVQSNLQR